MDDQSLVVNLSISPYDVPDAMRAFKLPEGRLVIEFQYVDGHEPMIEAAVDAVVTVRAGVHTKRIFGITIATAGLPRPLEVTVRPSGVPAAVLDVIRIVDRVSTAPEPNRKMISRAIQAQSARVAALMSRP